MFIRSFFFLDSVIWTAETSVSTLQEQSRRCSACGEFFPLQELRSAISLFSGGGIIESEEGTVTSFTSLWHLHMATLIGWLLEGPFLLLM